LRNSVGEDPSTPLNHTDFLVIVSHISPIIKSAIANTIIVQELWGNHPIIRNGKLRQHIGEAIPSLGTHSTERVIPLTIPNQTRSLANLITNIYLAAASIGVANQRLGINLYHHKLAYACVHKGLKASENSQDLPKGGGLHILLTSKILSRS
jgi:hypothetical protein